MHRRLFFSSLVTSVALVGCKTGTPPTGEGILGEVARNEIAGKWSASHTSGAVTPGWIRSFGDSSLTALVEEALLRNPDLRAAAARVDASRAAVRIAGAALYPYVGLKGLGERQGRELSGDLGLGMDPADLGSLGVSVSGGSADTRTLDSSSQRWIYGTGVGVSWELDVWGRVRSKKAAAKSDSLALEATYEYARQSLAAQVVRAYVSAVEAGQQAANAQEALKLYQEYVKLTDERKKQGFSSDFELAQVKSRTDAAEDTYHAAESARAQAIRAIEVITSHYPAAKASVRKTFPGTIRSVPSGLPAELLQRRPDLIASERRFAAAFHRTKEAQAARLPRFAVSAVGGLGTAQLDTVGVLDSVNWSLAGGVIQPIFFGGELKATQDLRTAEQKAAAYDYTAAALRAFSEVEDALGNDYHLRKRETALTSMVTNSADAIKFGRQQLDQGQADMFTILRLIGENLAAKVELTKVKGARLRERANLHLALGGDFRASSK